MVAIPLWIPQLSFVVGSALFELAVLLECIRVLQGHAPTYVARVAERHARGDYSEEL